MGETVLLDVRPHGRVVLRPLLTVLVLSAVGGVGLGVIQARLDPDLVVIAGAAWIVVLAVLALKWGVGPLLSWRGERLTLTSRRLVIRGGRLSRRLSETPVYSIRTVEYHQRFGERLFGSGTLIVGTFDQEKVCRDVPHIARVHEAVYGAVFGPAQQRRSAREEGAGSGLRRGDWA